LFAGAWGLGKKGFETPRVSPMGTLVPPLTIGTRNQEPGAGN